MYSQLLWFKWASSLGDEELERDSLWEGGICGDGLWVLVGSDQALIDGGWAQSRAPSAARNSD